jgi:hypothetical protein
LGQTSAACSRRKGASDPASHVSDRKRKDQETNEKSPTALDMRAREPPMSVELRNNKDLLAGLLMIGVGGAGFYMALDYPFGSALRMGPGYFPSVLAGILLAFGLYVGIRGFRFPERVEGIWGWKPLALITVAFWVYGWLMDHAGFIPSLIVLFAISTLAGHEFRLKEVITLMIVMITFAWAVFIYGLGLPYPLFWWQ